MIVIIGITAVVVVVVYAVVLVMLCQSEKITGLEMQETGRQAGMALAGRETGRHGFSRKGDRQAWL